LNIKGFISTAKNRQTTIIRHIVQVIAFLLINYVIIELIFSINLISLDGLVKVLPILNSPRNPISNGAGILEYILFFITEGIFPLFGFINFYLTENRILIMSFYFGITLSLFTLKIIFEFSGDKKKKK